MRLLYILICLTFAHAIHAQDSLTVFSLSNRTNIDFSASGTDQRVASFLVINPGAATPFTLIISFGNGCNVTHFRRPSINIPLTKVLVNITGAPGAITWNRTDDCIDHFTWTPPGPAYLDKYQVDVLISWVGKPMIVAGTYSENLSYWAYK